ncbi:MAG: rhodanese-like domain-containing protein, partial [Thermoleophilum sp.]|nr:rhodanese-like domain-containing protein [Thermoleophilum sp.]
AVSIPATGAGFGTKLAWIADRDQEIVFVGRDDADGRRAVALAEAVGLRRIAGFLAGGMTSWREERRPVRRIERMSASELRERLATRDGLQVLDVRERSEWRRCRIPGSVNIPYHELTSVPPGIDLARPIATVCGTGSRAGTAASLLARLGASRVLHVADGGVATWREAGWPVEGEGVTLRA